MPSIPKTADPASVDNAPPGREAALATARSHVVNGHPLKGPYPDGMETAVFAMGCFWGAEPLFWTLPGVHVTAAGYTAGITPNPTHDEVRSGRTGHAEAVLVVFDPRALRYETLLRTFWENHDPTQGAEIGGSHRSGIYVASDAQAAAAVASKEVYQQALDAGDLGAIATEIGAAGPFYFAEAHHQQHLARNPDEACGGGGTGVAYPMGGWGLDLWAFPPLYGEGGPEGLGWGPRRHGALHRPPPVGFAATLPTGGRDGRTLG